MSGRWTNGKDRARIDACVTGIVERILALESSTTGAEDTAKSRLDVLVRACGAERRSQQLVDALAQALDGAEVFFDPDLADLRLAPDTLIRFARRPLTGAQLDKELFPSEFALEKYLAQNLGHIRGLDGLKIVKTQFELPGDKKIDLLCEDRATGELVVVELKRGLPDRGIASQTLEYVKALAATPYAKGRTVSGLIITGAADYTLQTDALALARTYGHDLTWIVYDVALTVTEVASTGVPPARTRPSPAPDNEPDPTPAPAPGDEPQQRVTHNTALFAPPGTPLDY